MALLLAAHQESYRDELTGISGKLAYDQMGADFGSHSVLAVVGIDQLKQYGNQHGKAISEQRLRLIALKILASAGEGKVHRLAREEFTMLYPRKSPAATLVNPEAMRTAVADIERYVRGRKRVWERGLTARTTAAEVAWPAAVRIGVAESGEAWLSRTVVTKAARRALYKAKREGGTRVNRGAVSAEISEAVPAPVGGIVTCSEFKP